MECSLLQLCEPRLVLLASAGVAGVVAELVRVGHGGSALAEEVEGNQTTSEKRPQGLVDRSRVGLEHLNWTKVVLTNRNDWLGRVPNNRPNIPLAREPTNCVITQRRFSIIQNPQSSVSRSCYV